MAPTASDESPRTRWAFIEKLYKLASSFFACSLVWGEILGIYPCNVSLPIFCRHKGSDRKPSAFSSGCSPWPDRPVSGNTSSLWQIICKCPGFSNEVLQILRSSLVILCSLQEKWDIRSVFSPLCDSSPKTLHWQVAAWLYQSSQVPRALRLDWMSKVLVLTKGSLIILLFYTYQLETKWDRQGVETGGMTLHQQHCTNPNTVIFLLANT